MSKVLSSLVMALGAVVLIGGWILEMRLLQSLHPGLETMKPNTAALFTLLGGGLWLLNRSPRAAAIRIAKIIGGVVVGVAIATLAEYLFRIDLGIDQILARGPSGSPYPGRMAPATAVDFLLLGVALELRARSESRISEIAGLLAAASAFMALCGYLYGARSLYAIGAYASIALHTSIGFLAASSALLLGRPDRGLAGLLASDTDAGRLLRRLLPAIVLGPIVLGLLRQQGERAGYYDTPFGLALMVLSTVILLTLFTSIVASSLHRSELGREEEARRRMLADQRLRAQLEEIVEGSPQAIAMFDTSMHYIHASERWLHDYGLSSSAIGKSHYELFPELPERWKAVHERCLQGAIEENDGERFVRADGTVQWVRWKVCPWREADGAIGGLLIFAEDTTAPREAEAERTRLFEQIRSLNANLERTVNERTRDLMLAKETLDGIITIAADAIITTDQDQRITMFNRGAEEVFGWRREEVMGQPIDLLLPERFRMVHRGHIASFAKELIKARKMGERRAIFGRRKDGEEFPAEAGISKLEVGSRSLFTVILRDVSEERHFIQQQAVLVRIGEILEATVSVTEVAQQMAEAVLPFFGDACGIVVVHDDVTRAHLVHAVPDLMPGVEALRKYGVPEKSLTWKAFELEQSVVEEALPPDYFERISADAEQLRLLHALELRTCICFPLLAHGRCHGAISFYSRDANRRYKRDFDVIAEVARRLAVALDSGFLRERVELEAAITVHLGEGVFLIRSADGTIAYTNPQFERMFGYLPGELLGKHVSIVNAPTTASPEQRADEIVATLRRSGGWRGEVENIRKDGTTFWCFATVASFDHPEFGPVWIAVHTDITERKQHEQERARRHEERATLLKEIHHRVKNNLQVIASLLYLQREQASSDSLKKFLDESRTRIQAIALVHEKLYQAGDLARIDLGDYLKSLASTVAGAIGGTGPAVRVEVRAETAALDIERAIPCALIVNELLSNALKHGFPAGRRGEVRVTVRPIEPKLMEVEVSDDGVGFPLDIDFTKTATLGMQLVVSLTKQLRGTVELHRARGTTFRIRFPVTADGAARAATPPVVARPS